MDEENWINLIYDREKWRAAVSKKMSAQIKSKAVNFLFQLKTY
jgi:hypothetical protein